MSCICMLRSKPNFVSIPLEQAMYCGECNAVNNSPNNHCGRCGSEVLIKVTVPAGGPPEGPEAGPAAALCIPPATSFELLSRAA
jgi:DNA-directed RNA polymerase subunit RPC12/RpoP